MSELKLKALPPPSNLSPSVLSFLDHQLYNKETLAQAPTLVIDLQSQCHELSHSLIDLNRSLKHTLLSQSTFSDRLHGLLGDVNGKLMSLDSLTRSRSSTQGLCSLLSCRIIRIIIVSCMVFMKWEIIVYTHALLCNFFFFCNWVRDLCLLICYRSGDSWWGVGEGAVVVGKRSGENGDRADVCRWVAVAILPRFLLGV